jgi:hypothetical protein
MAVKFLTVSRLKTCHNIVENRIPIRGCLILVLLCGLTFPSCLTRSPNTPVVIEIGTDHVPMGSTIEVVASIKPVTNDQMILLPYVNGRRWGSHEFADAEGRATFHIPLPNPGPAMIQVIAIPSDTDDWQGIEDFNLLRTGSYLPEEADLISNRLLVNVNRREIPEWEPGETLFGMQWESWFTPGPWRWKTAQAVPLMGMYDNTDPDVYRQQILWFMDLGVDFVMADWSNHIWGKKHWTERSDFADGILHTTQMFLETMADMRDEGLPVPRVVLMPGLTNGPPTTMEALNEQLEWIYQDYVRNPRFKGLWLIYDGKPLIIILDTGILAHKDGRTESAFRIPFFKWSLTGRGTAFTEEEIDILRQKQGPVDDTHFTVRWMSSQNQATRHHELGHWSWMDGSLAPMVTYRDGKPEVVTVTPSFFAEWGWTAPEAYGRRSGWTYLESFKTALEHRPRVIMLHQFNEYHGQAIDNGHGPDKDVFLDSYSVELSDDLEPVSLTAPGYRGDQGGWGFYYLNLTQALMDIYRGSEDVTLLAVHTADSIGDDIRFEWTSIGVLPDSYTVLLDGETILEETAALEYSIPKGDLQPGEHSLSVRANGVGTRYKLSLTELDIPAVELMPVVVEKTFRIR